MGATRDATASSVSGRQFLHAGARRCSADRTRRTDAVAHAGSWRPASGLSSRCMRSCVPFSCGLAGVMRARCRAASTTRSAPPGRECPWRRTARRCPCMASGKPTSRNKARKIGLASIVLTEEAVTRQHAAAEVIGYGERIAVLPVAGAELAFEVRGPDLIGALRRNRSGAGMRPFLPPPMFVQQAAPREDRVQLRAERGSGAASAAPAAASSRPSRTPVER